MKRLIKRKAWKEVDVLQYNPEYLADKILKLWNQIDGTLQNTFEAFTLRYSNREKQEIAEVINNRGYEVYPVFIQDSPMYGADNSYANIINKICGACKKVKKTTGIRRLSQDLLYVKEHNLFNNDIANTLIDYYSALFPEDYSLSLIKNHFSDNYLSEFRGFDKFEDYQISDESLEQIEKWDSETDNSTYLKDNTFDGYDFVSDMRYDTTEPNNYEVSNGTNNVYRLTNKRLKKKL